MCRVQRSNRVSFISSQSTLFVSSGIEVLSRKVLMILAEGSTTFRAHEMSEAPIETDKILV